MEGNKPALAIIHKRGDEVHTKKNEKTSCKEDHVCRLPEEVLLSILNRLRDLKSLFQCSLVCKYFASVVSYVRNVSISIPSAGVHNNESLRDITSLFCELHLAGPHQIPELDLPFLQKLKPLIFLKTFRELESIYMESTPLENSVSSSFLQWKVKFSGDGAKCEGFVALLPASVHKWTADEPEGVGRQNPTRFGESQLKDCFYLSYGRYVEWMCLICLLAKNHTSLSKVTIADSKKQGKLVIGDEQLVKIRGGEFQELVKYLFINGLHSFQVAGVPVLHLPSSGYIMRWVYLLILNPTKESNTSAKKVDEIVSWNFEEEEKPLGEAIKEFSKNHKDKFLND